jgi:uncharacterized tellurite resistance protein B-like protein
MNPNYQLGLLCLAHLLISADGIVDHQELDALRTIKKNEKITDDLYKKFEKIIEEKKERELFQKGIELINLCTDDEKLRVCATLYKLSEVDGRVHVKEIRLLLYSIKLVGVEFDDVVNKAIKLPSLL